MIAASDPQEFVPSGRQQALRHPAPADPHTKKLAAEPDDFLLNKLEKVSLVETNQIEWWLLRKTPTEQKPNSDNDLNQFENKSYVAFPSSKSQSSFLEDISKSVDVSKFSKRLSEASYKRLSLDNDQKSESKYSECYKYYGKETTTSVCGKVDASFLEEELYVKGNTAIWSRGLLTNGNIDNGRKVICAYTIPLPIKHVLWCNFYCERPSYDANLIDMHVRVDEPTGIQVPAVCIIDSYNLRVFTPKGEDFVIAIPFPIGKVWNTRFGVIIEKENDNQPQETLYENQATLYSLAFPLDDICPVAVNQNNLFQLHNKPNMSVVFTSEEPSICMLYDSQTKQHSVYRIRKVKMDEKFSIKMQSTCNSRINSSSKLKSRFSMWDNVISSNNVIPSSPVSSKPISMASFCQLQQSRSHSSMAAISRCQSPAASSSSCPWMMQNSRLSCSLPPPEVCNNPANGSFSYCSKSMSHLRSNPTICLDYLWTDTYSVQEPAVAGPASKVFLSEDLAGQWYLCYMLHSRYQLSIVRIDFTSNITFGMLTSISAKDAVPIPHLHMLAILEHNGNVTLYSGLAVVGKLHIGGTLAQHTPSPYIRRSLPQFNSPFPRRSSLLPHCKQTDPKFEDHLLSPVLPPVPGFVKPTIHFNYENSPRAVLTGLTDAIENRLTLKYSDGTFYRITLPNLATSSLVESCLVTLRQCLQRDASITLLCRWYATKNVLGTENIKPEQEWNMFTALVFDLLGYEEEHSSEMSREAPVTPSANIKRQRQLSEGSNDDWIFLLNSNQHQKNNRDICKLLNLEPLESIKQQDKEPIITLNIKSVLFPYIRIIHFALHLLYEDLKLNTLRKDDLCPLMKMLNRFSNDLGLEEYSLHYWKDFPEHALVQMTGRLSQSDLKNVNAWVGCDGKPISIMQHIYDMLNGRQVPDYPYLDNVNIRSRDIVQLCGVLSGHHPPNHVPEMWMESFVKNISSNSFNVEPMQVQYKVPATDCSLDEQLVLLMVEMKITPQSLDTYPVGISFMLYSVLWKCRENPRSDWPPEAYYLLSREDLAEQALKVEKGLSFTNAPEKSQVFRSVSNDSELIDGMEEIDSSLMRLRFPDDVRVAETKAMLQSSKPVPIVLVQRPDVSDHDFIEEQEKHLYAICTRTMALPVGRGMFTLHTSTPVATEPLPTPTLCLTGKAPPRGTTVELSHIDTPANMSLWPLFHNGVANGLRIAPDADYIDNTWIIFNKPKSNVDHQMEHAGFLMALGLNGHLKNLTMLSTYDYLAKLHEMTSVSVLLGLSASFRGSSHLGLTKALSIHIEALLPPTSMELDVPQNLQVAALLGIGLLYERTAHRHITEVLLSEIGRPPGPEMENSVDRESYSLAAGLALGLVTLKQGSEPVGLADLNVPDTLHYYMVGGNRRPLTGSQKDKYKVPSFQIREGSCVNLDVTAPGATLALGLMYLGTGNKAVADWMAPPATQYLLDFVRPDFLMLRILSRSLILWDDIEPSKEWVEGQVPASIRPYCMVKPSPLLDVDYEAMNQAYCNIVTGACFALGLKFAGSADQDAFETLLYFCHMFTKLTSKSIAELAGKPTIETCLNVLMLSVSMVMAGTGNLEVMRLVRHLRRRVGVSTSAVVTYGSHLAVHMALGLLFLGGGRYTLSNSPASVAALICAFYPKFPTHSNDNRYHLQAFRHLYVLAVEPRVVIPKDIHLEKSCYANLQVVKLDGTTISIKGPGILPDLNTLIKVSIDDERYWPVVFERGHNWDLLIKILSTTGNIEVKQRAGCLSYVVDKYGYLSQLARTLTQSGILPWDPSPSSIISFTCDEAIKYFSEEFLVRTKTEEASPRELRFRQILGRITYEAVIKDKLNIIVVFTTLMKTVLDLEESPSSYNLWQLKLITTQVLSNFSSLLAKEAVLALQQETVGILDKWEQNLKPLLKNYIVSEEFISNTDDLLPKLAAYVLYYDIPYKCDLAKGELLEVAFKLQINNFANQTILKVVKHCCG